MLRKFVDEIAPEHQRTSCSDEDSRGNEYFNEAGYPRCVRCAFLHRLANGEWPHGARFTVVGMVVKQRSAVERLGNIAEREES